MNDELLMRKLKELDSQNQVIIQMLREVLDTIPREKLKTELRESKRKVDESGEVVATVARRLEKIAEKVAKLNQTSDLKAQVIDLTRRLEEAHKFLDVETDGILG